MSSKDETMRLLIKLLVETSPEGREEINVVAQKTVTNSDIIILDKLFSGKAANFASLVMKLDPAKSASYPNLLTSSLDYLLGDITRKVLIGIKKFTEESITLFSASPSG